jgi:hypothetical protein
MFVGLDNRPSRWARGYKVRVDRDLPADATTTAALAVGVARRAARSSARTRTGTG